MSIIAGLTRTSVCHRIGIRLHFGTSLGIKQLTDDPWADLAKEFSVGTEIAECEIARILDCVVVVNLSADVEGFIPLNQLGQDVNQPSRIYKVGDNTPGKVIEFDLEGRIYCN